MKKELSKEEQEFMDFYNRFPCIMVHEKYGEKLVKSKESFDSLEEGWTFKIKKGINKTDLGEK